MNKDKIEFLLNSVSYRFAKSMPTIPHEYSHRNDWINDKDFCDVVMYIRENGKKKKFWKKEFIYYQCGEYEYWTMGNPLSYTDKTKTFILNRAKIC